MTAVTTTTTTSADVCHCAAPPDDNHHPTHTLEKNAETLTAKEVGNNHTT